MESISQRSWFIAYTYPNFEKKIYGELIRKNLKAYLPMQRVIREWSDRKKEIQMPLFPNYIFINTTEKERISFFKINGILKFISFDGRPAVISDNEIVNIRRFEDTIFEVEPHLIEGEDVMIVKGPFTGLCGTLFSKKGKSRFGIRLLAINQSLSLEIDISCIRKI
ncbi:NusG antitermination factor [Arcticibacter svalbardensis MN12-7]|uniref:NusG antitermination factor n=1 Tax=Arcticibacter svalbardensis MN12-7 TaxID=1150600 RepID=R9GNV4_9SPHI|nr:UpxY family transcription antiterminator [Arcticibacter svalbardensis]EOR93408.1 NusG antitermination factor [Arcticibacter svalbardensis MN12-7]